MIGVINNRKVFEYRTMDELVTALDFMATREGKCEIIIISDAADKVKGVIVEERAEFEIMLEPQTNYYVRFIKLPSSQRASELEFPKKNDKLSTTIKQMKEHRLKIYRLPVPGDLD